MANPEREIFAENLRSTLKKTAISQAELAEKLGVSRGTVSDYVYARAYPRPERMARLCTILGVSQYDLTTNHYKSKDSLDMNREVLVLAKELLDDAAARNLYAAIRELDEDERKIVAQLVEKLRK